MSEGRASGSARGRFSKIFGFSPSLSGARHTATYGRVGGAAPRLLAWLRAQTNVDILRTGSNTVIAANDGNSNLLRLIHKQWPKTYTWHPGQWSREAGLSFQNTPMVLSDKIHASGAVWCSSGDSRACVSVRSRFERRGRAVWRRRLLWN